MDMTGVIGIVISAISLVVAIHQTILKHKIERHQHADIWTNIAITVRTFDSLDQIQKIIRADNDKILAIDSKMIIELAGEIANARRGTVDQWRQLLKQAVLSEQKYNEETIQRWADEGKLENKWRIEQAHKLLGPNNACKKK
ncbi:MAG: hypothetical protein LBL48_02800 [Azoarcus sp.]|jgi:hypothetical protein|nr:hypothetical protein [Azoarcus sp.]